MKRLVRPVVLFKVKSDNNAPENNPIHWRSGNDAKMNQAIEKSQNTFGDFYNALKSSIKENRAFDVSLVKYMVKAELHGVEAEHLFASDLYITENGDLIGYICSDPEHTRKIKNGDKVTINKDNISDWAYVENGNAYGGNTFSAMWDAFTRAEKSSYKDQPPFIWFNFK